MRATILAVAALFIVVPLSVSAHWNHVSHSGRNGSGIQVPSQPSNPNQGSASQPGTTGTTTAPNPTSFTLGAFNATVGSVCVYFTDVTDLYTQSCPNQTEFVFLENNTVSNTQIASGAYDTKLKAWAAQLPPGTIISFGHEFDLTDNPWGGNPTTFLAAYKHVHDLLGPTFKYAWVANNSDTPGTPGIGAYFPGSSYIDIYGIDGFDWGGESLSQSLQPNFAIVKAYATANAKPLWITSTGTASNQASWITTGLAWAQSNGVSGLLYFSYDSGENFALTPAGLAALQ